MLRGIQYGMYREAAMHERGCLGARASAYQWRDTRCLPWASAHCALAEPLFAATTCVTLASSCVTHFAPNCSVSCPRWWALGSCPKGTSALKRITTPARTCTTDCLPKDSRRVHYLLPFVPVFSQSCSCKHCRSLPCLQLSPSVMQHANLLVERFPKIVDQRCVPQLPALGAR